MSRLRVISLPTIAVLVFLALWELVARLWIRNYPLFPPLISICAAFVQMLRSGELVKDAFASLLRACAGFLVGSSFGVLLGILTARIGWLHRSLNWFILFFKSIPAIALVPLAILWFGIGETTKVFLVSWGVLFPVWINSYMGAAAAEKEYVWAAQSLGASDTALLFQVIVPRAVPFVLAGLRVGIGLAFITIIAAEMAGAFFGLGYRLQVSELVFRTDRMIADLLVLGALGLGADKLFMFTSRRCFRWIRWTDNDVRIK